MIQDIEQTDARLLSAWTNQGDQQALATLIDRYAPLVMGVCRRQCRQAADAEDAFQVTFMVLARSAHTIRAAVALPAWLHATACRVARRSNQSSSNHTETPIEAADSCASALDEIARRHELRILDEELEQMPAQLRNALILHYLEGHRVKHVAQQLGTTLGSTRGRLQRGRDELRRRLILRGVSFSALLVSLRALESCAEAASQTSLCVEAIKSHGEWYHPQPTAPPTLGSSADSLFFPAVPGTIMKVFLLASAASIAITAWINTSAGPGTNASNATIAGGPRLAHQPLEVAPPDLDKLAPSSEALFQFGGAPSRPAANPPANNDPFGGAPNGPANNDPFDRPANGDPFGGGSRSGGGNRNADPFGGGGSNGDPFGGNAPPAATPRSASPSQQPNGTAPASPAQPTPQQPTPQQPDPMTAGGGQFGGGMGGMGGGMGGMGGGMGGMGGTGGFSPPPVIKREPTAYERKLASTLEQPQTASLQASSLDELAKTLQNQFGIPVVVPKFPNFETVEVNSPISIASGDLPLGAALKNALRPYRLKTLIRDDALMIVPDTAALAKEGIGTSKYINVNDKYVQQMESILDQPISIELIEVPLEDAIRTIVDQLSGSGNKPQLLQISINSRDLEDIGLTTDIPVTISLKDITAAEMLSAILEPLDLSYRPKSGYVEITTYEAAEDPANMLLRIYWLDGTGFGSLDSVMEILQTSVDPDTWEALGGPSTIAPLYNSSSGRVGIVVGAPYSIHRDIEVLLDSIREGLVDPVTEIAPPQPQPPMQTGQGQGGFF